MPRIRIDTLDRPTEETLDAPKARGVYGAGPLFRGGIIAGPVGRPLYTWTPGVSYWGGSTVFYNTVPTGFTPWGGYGYYYNPTVIINGAPLYYGPWGW